MLHVKPYAQNARAREAFCEAARKPAPRKGCQPTCKNRLKAVVRQHPCKRPKRTTRPAVRAQQTAQATRTPVRNPACNHARRNNKPHKWSLRPSGTKPPRFITLKLHRHAILRTRFPLWPKGWRALHSLTYGAQGDSLLDYNFQNYHSQLRGRHVHQSR